MPKFAVLVSASAEAEAGKMPTTQELTEMTSFNDELRKAGVLLLADGFLSSSNGARVHFNPDGSSKVEHGPFGLDNLVAGFWVWKLDSLEQAVEWASKIPFTKGRVEIRRIAGEEDFGPNLTDALRKKVRTLREETEGGA
jgi:hypothetical protein